MSAESPQDKKNNAGCGCGCLLVIILLLFAMCPTKNEDSKRRERLMEDTKSSSGCYDDGYRFGRCSATALKGLPCNPADDIVIPEQCRGKDETHRGIKDGSYSVLKKP